METVMIREPECFKITGLSRSTRWRLEQEGKFPKRYKMSENIIAWKLQEIQDWIDSKTHAPGGDYQGKKK